MEHDPLDIEITERAKASLIEDAKHAARVYEDDIKWLMGSKRGRRIVNRLLQDAGVFRISFSTNALQMSFNEGNRNSGLKLLAAISEYCPNRYIEMTEEAKQ